MSENPFTSQYALANALPPQQGKQQLNSQPVDRLDVLLDAVRDMTRQVSELRAMVAALRRDMHGKPELVMFPTNALKWSR